MKVGGSELPPNPPSFFATKKGRGVEGGSPPPTFHRRILLALPLAAQAPDPLRELMSAFAAVRERRATFTEERELSELDRPLVSRGVLLWHAPDRMEKHTIEPVEERFLAQGDSVVLEQPARGIREVLALDAVPEIRPVVEAIRATLAGDAATLREHHEVAFSGSIARWRMVLTPRSVRVRAAVQRITLEGEGAAILAMESQIRDGRIRMAITPAR